MVNAILTAILSFFVPGLGQAVAGNIKKGIILFVIFLILITITQLIVNPWIVYLIDIIYSLYAAYDAYQMAK